MACSTPIAPWRPAAIRTSGARRSTQTPSSPRSSGWCPSGRLRRKGRYQDPKTAECTNPQVMISGDNDVTPCLQLDLGSKLDDTIGRDAEELGCRLSIPRHEDEELLAPAHHFTLPSWKNALAIQEIARLHGLQSQSVLRRAQLEDLWHTRCLHEAVPGPHTHEALLERSHRHSLGILDGWHLDARN